MSRMKAVPSFSSISKNKLSTGSNIQTGRISSTLTSTENSTLKSNSSNGRKLYKLTKSFKNVNSSFNVNKSKIQNRKDAELFVDSSEVSGRCDWSASFEQLRLTANEKPGARKRVRDRVMESENEDNWSETKKQRIWGGRI